MEKTNENINKIIADFKKNYDIKSIDDLKLNISDNNKSELGGCIFLINKMIKDFEYYLNNGYNIGNVKKEFFEDYKELMKKYIKLYCTEFTNDLYEQKFSSEQIKYIYDKMTNTYNLDKLSIKEVTNLLNKEFMEFIPKKENKKEIKTEVIDFKETKKHKIIVNKDDYDILKDDIEQKLNDIDNSFSTHSMYKEKIKEIIDFKNDSEKKLSAMLDLYKENKTKTLKQKIDHEINSLYSAINALLDKAYELEVAKTNAINYLSKLIKKKYFDVSREQEFKDRIINCTTPAAVYKYHNILYTNYFYPKKVREIKQRLDKKVVFWIETDKKNEKEFNKLKKYIYDLLDNGSDKLNEQDLIELDNMGIATAYEKIEEMKNKNNKKR